jgi:hypothetical protein
MAEEVEDSKEIAGISREIGYGKPPPEHKFSTENQPKNRGKRNGFHLRPLLKKKLASVEPGDERSCAEKFIDAEYERAVKVGGDSAKRVWEYVEGKPEQPITGADGGELVIRHIFEELAKRDGES